VAGSTRGLVRTAAHLSMEGVDVEAVDVCVVEAVAELPEGERIALHGRPVLKHLPARRAAVRGQGCAEQLRPMQLA